MVTVTIIKLVARFLKLSLYCTFSFFIVKGTIRLNRGEDEIMGKGATPFYAQLQLMQSTLDSEYFVYVYKRYGVLI